jgi:malonate transporter and related proteins
MERFLAVLADPILPVFAIMALGFGLGRAGRVSRSDAEVLNRFALTVFLPVMLFGVLAQAPLDRFEPWPLVAYALSEAVVWLAGFLLARRVFRRPPMEALLLAFCGVFGNNALYVLPIGLFLYGEAGSLPLTAIVTLDSGVAFGFTLVALEVMKGRGTRPLAIVGRVLRLPLLVGSLAGLAVAASGVGLAAPFATFARFAGGVGAPLALFALGVVLSQTRFTASPVVASYCAIKIAVFPLAVWAGLSVLAPEAETSRIYLLGAAAPSGAMAFSLGLLYGAETSETAQIIVWTSLGTLASLALLA